MAKKDMNKEIVIATVKAEMSLEEMKATIDAIVSMVNDAYLQDDLFAVRSANNALSDSIKLYNEHLRKAEYDKWLATETPVLTALQQKTVDQYKVKNGKVSNSETPQISLDTKAVMVDLMELSEHAGLACKLFTNGQWIYQCENFAELMNMKLTEDICDDNASRRVMRELVKKNFDMSKEARTLDENDQLPNALSNTSLKKCMGMIANNIYSVEGSPYEIKSEDLGFLTHCLTNASSRKVTALRNITPKIVISTMTRVMIKLVNNLSYEIEWSKKKNS